MTVDNDELIGRVIAGQYRVVSHLGTGAMATIYRARDDDAGRDVAVKVVKASIVDNKTAAARFHREAKAASKLRHPGIVHIEAWGFDGAIPYIVMELIEGEDLFEVLDRRGALSEKECLEVVVALCGALGAAHAEGVVHRDLKPENIMVAGLDGATPVTIKVLDFGIAKLVNTRPGDLWGDETVPQVLTKVGSAVGTPSHMAPEQARGDPVDGRTDIYACGVLMYEMVTGHLPFEGDNPLHVAIRQVRDPPPPPSTHNGDLHPELEAIILRALEKDPGARFQSARDLQRALLDVLAEIDSATSETLERDDDEMLTAQRSIPPGIIDDDLEQMTVQHHVPHSLRGMTDKRSGGRDDEPATKQRRALEADDDDDDPLTRVVRDTLDEPMTMELDTVAGPTMRRRVHGHLRAVIDSTLASMARDKDGIVDEPSVGERTPFVGRRQLARADGTTPQREDLGTTERLQPTGAHTIEDEDSEGTFPTIVADAEDVAGEAARLVREARAIAEASQRSPGSADPVHRSHRDPALSITKQSDFGAFIDVAAGPAVQVLTATTDPSPPVYTEYAKTVPPPPPSAIVGDPTAATLSVGQPSVGPQTRGVANELEDLLKQMPHQRQPIVGSVIVLIFLAVAIVALVYLLVGAATF